MENPNVEPSQICNTPQEQIYEAFPALNFMNKCPLCELPIGRHMTVTAVQESPQSNTSFSSTEVSVEGGIPTSGVASRVLEARTELLRVLRPPHSTGVTSAIISKVSVLFGM